MYINTCYVFYYANKRPFLQIYIIHMCCVIIHGVNMRIFYNRNTATFTLKLRKLKEDILQSKKINWMLAEQLYLV